MPTVAPDVLRPAAPRLRCSIVKAINHFSCGATQMPGVNAPLGSVNLETRISLGSTFAVLSHLKIKERTATGRAGTADDGRWIGGPYPLGYTTDDAGRLVIQPAEAELVTRMFELVASGHSLGQTAKLVTEEFQHRRETDMPKRTGGQGWGYQAVANAIRRQVYYGAGHPKKVRPEPWREQVEYVIPAPAIVDLETWQAANKALGGRRRQPKKVLKNWAYGLGNGRIVHVHDDGTEVTMLGRARADTKPSTRHYLCKTAVAIAGKYKPGSPERCRGFGKTFNGRRMTGLRAPIVEAAVIQAVLPLLSDPDNLAKWVRDAGIRQAGGDPTQSPADIVDEMNKNREAIKVERANVLRQHQRGYIDDDALDVAMRDLAQREAKIMEQLQGAQVQALQAEKMSNFIESLLSVPPGFALDAFGPDSESEGFWVPRTDGVGDDWVTVTPGWNDVAKWLDKESRLILESDERRELPEEVVKWCERMAEVLDIRVKVFDQGTDRPRVEAHGQIPMRELMVQPSSSPR